MSHIRSLVVQGASVTTVIDVLKPRQIAAWSSEINLLPTPLFNFSRKALQQQLPSKANLQWWGKRTDETCPLCHEKQTNKHVLNNCSSPAALDRYKVRHDALLRIICSWLNTIIKSPLIMHADLGGRVYPPLSMIFKHLRPDIAIVGKNCVTILELTVCHETNLQKSKLYKCEKYSSIQNDCVQNYEKYNCSGSLINDGCPN